MEKVAPKYLIFHYSEYIANHYFSYVFSHFDLRNRYQTKFSYIFAYEMVCNDKSHCFPLILTLYFWCINILPNNKHYFVMYCVIPFNIQYNCIWRIVFIDINTSTEYCSNIKLHPCQNHTFPFFFVTLITYEGNNS